MFAKLSIFYFVFVAAVSAASLPVRTIANPAGIRPFNPIVNGPILPKRGHNAVDDAVAQLRSYETQFADNRGAVRQLEIYVQEAITPGANLTQILSEAQAFVAQSPAEMDHDLIFNNAILQLQFYASEPIRQWQQSGNRNAVNALLSDINQLAIQVAAGNITLGAAYNQTADDINALLGDTRKREFLDLRDVNSTVSGNSTNSNSTSSNASDIEAGLFQLELIASSSVTLLQVTGRSVFVQSFLDNIQIIGAYTQNGSMEVPLAIQTATLNIASALAADPGNATNTKRDLTTDYIINRFEGLVNNAILLLRAANQPDIANNLSTQLTSLFNQAQNGTLTAQDAFNQAVGAIAYALTSRPIAQKREVVAKRNLNTTENAIQLLVDNAISLLTNAGRSDIATSLQNQVNQLYSQAQNGAIDLLQLLNAANLAIFNALH